MRTITFKNGKTLEITQKAANTIKDVILKGDAKFQMFGDDEGLFLLINIEDISFIQ